MPHNYVVFRDNTNWGAAVVTTMNTSWGGEKRPLFQKHAVSICQDITGRFITNEEAHYICGCMNTPAAYDYVLNSSDARSFPIRPRIYIPKFDPLSAIHVKIAELSKEAHQKYNSTNEMNRIVRELNELYLTITKTTAPKEQIRAEFETEVKKFTKRGTNNTIAAEPTSIPAFEN